MECDFMQVIQSGIHVFSLCAVVQKNIDGCIH